ncbi:MAG: hypothetical protein ABGY75_06195 [Gemmataceae bacterium]
MRTLLAIGLVGLLAGFAGAADKKNDPTGTWKWETERNGMKRTSTLKLKLDGDKLTGSIPGRQNMETKIEDGTFKDGEVAFTVTREMNGNKIVTKYKGKVDGDTMKLTIEREGGQGKQEVEAKKEKADK